MIRDLKQNYSSNVWIELNIGDASLAVERTGPDYVILKTGADLEAGKIAVLRMLIDDREHVKLVKLVQGAVPFDRTVKIRAVK